MADEQEAVLSCGDVVTEFPEKQSDSKVHWARCNHPDCRGQWRRVVEIRPRTG